ncbi:MAG: hypothetical protein IIA87_04825 [Nanoarchaeota archaeon]|nr:hypothetical protein [Nanoarchaeota archaeon]
MRLGIDIIGNIAILKFDRNAKLRDKKKFAEKLLRSHKQITSVLEKVGKFSGRLRTQKTKFLAGEKTKEALYKENECIFRLNVDSCYFSPRLSSERKEIAGMVKKGESVLVMFGGIAPYSVVIAKKRKAKKVVSVEIGRECNKYAKINVKRNKVEDVVELIQGDVRKVFESPFLSTVNSKSSSSLAKRQRVFSVQKKVSLIKERFDRIVMARPNLKDSFLDVAFSKIKRNGVIHYYGFYEEKNKSQIKELILSEAKKARKEVKILRVKKAGDVGPYRFRYRADVKVFG